MSNHFDLIIQILERKKLPNFPIHKTKSINGTAQLKQEIAPNNPVIFLFSFFYSHVHRLCRGKKVQKSRNFARYRRANHLSPLCSFHNRKLFKPTPKICVAFSIVRSKTKHTGETNNNKKSTIPKYVETSKLKGTRFSRTEKIPSQNQNTLGGTTPQENRTQIKNQQRK